MMPRQGKTFCIHAQDEGLSLTAQGDDGVEFGGKPGRVVARGETGQKTQNHPQCHPPPRHHKWRLEIGGNEVSHGQAQSNADNSSELTNDHDFNQELQPDCPARRAEALACPNFPCAFTHGNQHDVHEANARADLAQAELNLTRCEIRAPISGTIGQRSARNGQVVQAGAYLLSIVPDEDIWVQANFKETQIGHMQPGQRAELLFDSYPDTPIEGRVDSLFAASGAQFSLLPPDNATGNFTKVVQRIPVKLTFRADNPLHGRIRPGMSVTATVDLRNEDEGHDGR